MAEIDVHGSPPQVRGKPNSATDRGRTVGITPAGAGKTIMCRTCTATTRDHPRRCGENFSVIIAMRNNRGSPPQVRGKLYAATGSVQPARITPAGAGKTKTVDEKGAENRDHPRRCGENCDMCCIVQRSLGSPPQVRGKPDAAPLYRGAARITPAGAGKTVRRCRPCGYCRDHPRRCGENLTDLLLQCT